jgi:hypothetical protein
MKASRKGKSEKPEVVHAWCELAHGPGWTNPLVWVLLRDARGRFSLEGLQPGEYGEVLRALHPVADIANRTLCALTRKDVLSAWPTGFCRLECVVPGPRGGYVLKTRVIDTVDNVVAHALSGVVRTVTEFARHDWEEARP